MQKTEVTERKLAFLTYDCLDEWLDGVKLELDGLRDEMGAGWFNCLQALELAGAQCVMYGTSARVTKPTRMVHLPTGASICILPSSRFYRWLKGLANWLRASDGSEPNALRGLFRRMFDMASGYFSLPIFTFYRELRRDECRCLLVEQYGTPRFDICVLAARIQRIRVFGLFATQIRETSPLTHLAYPLRSLAYQMCDGFVIATSAEIDRLKTAYALPAHRFARIPYPVDTTLWHEEDKTECRKALSIACEDRIALWHGGIDIWMKGLDILLLAWQRLNIDAMQRPWTLLIVGGASPEESVRLNEMMARTQVTGVTFVDRWILDRDLLQSYLSAADVYVLPSRSDAFPISTLEAMACGCPPIISSGAGTSELLAEGEAAGGLVVKSEDPRALAAALERLLGDSQLSAELGHRARQTVEMSASMQTVGRQLVDFLLGPQPRAAASRSGP